MAGKYKNIVHAFYRLTAFCLACIYFSFQVEIFEEENEKNNPLPCSTPTITYSAFNWESFDKTNAPQAFVFVIPDTIVLVSLYTPALGDELPAFFPYLVIRDKSPPFEPFYPKFVMSPRNRAGDYRLRITDYSAGMSNAPPIRNCSLLG
jgi:hypothetical protein